MQPSMAVRFDSAGEALRRTANLPPETFTICGYAVIVTDTNGVMSIASLESAALGAYVSFGVRTDLDPIEVSLVYTISGSPTDVVVTTTTVGTPFFWALVSSGTGVGQVTAYVRLASSSSLLSSSNGSGRDAITAAVMSFGALSDDSWPFNGRIWNVKCWDRALSVGELLIESYYRRVMFPSSVNLNWRLANTSDTNDYSGNGRNPTVAGTLSTEDGAHGLWCPRRKINTVRGRWPHIHKRYGWAQF